jgi:hypothetical protein
MKYKWPISFLTVYQLEMTVDWLFNDTRLALILNDTFTVLKQFLSKEVKKSAHVDEQVRSSQRIGIVLERFCNYYRHHTCLHIDDIYQLHSFVVINHGLYAK